MANYDFSTLNSSDLEELVCDLLNYNQKEESGIKYKTFKDAKDSGIDFYYSRNSFYDHVGQVKHYYRTGYEGLYNSLKNEVKKVAKLRPNRYILATSVDLSLKNTESIRDLFEPFIKNLHDIYGKKDLNKLIDKHNEILTNHYKLWLSDFSILTKLLNSALEFRSSQFVENELKKRLRLYVRTSIFDKSRKLLKNNNFIIITGEPGIGKTTLAEMLIYEYIAEGYNLSYILDDIKEAEKVLLPNDSKQIIYFDDFLGSNKVEINRAKGSETALRSILRRVSKMENKLVVFTTRTFLLNTAVEESEKLRDFNIKAKSSLIELNEYSEEIKKKLLANHIEEAEIDIDLRAVLNKEEIQDFITTHQNFNPRTVEFITSKGKINNFSGSEFENFIFESFNYPADVWRHAYSEQISEEERLFLNTLITFGNYAELVELEEAFNSRIQFEVETNNRVKEMYLFKKTLNRLNGGFIILRYESEVHFLNPSLIDFLQKYLQEDKDEVDKMILSIKYVSQLTARLFSLGSATKNKIPKKIEDRLINDYSSFINNDKKDFDLIQLVLVINKFMDNEKKDVVICNIIEKITTWDELHEDYSIHVYFREFMKTGMLNEKIYTSLNLRITEIISKLFIGISDLKEGIDFLEEMQGDFEIDFKYADNKDILSHLELLFSDEISEYIDDYRARIKEVDEVFEKKDEFEDFERRITDIGIEYNVDFSEFHTDWEQIAWENQMRDRMETDD